MSKSGEIKFESLERLGEDPPARVPTDEELLEIISDKDVLKKVVKKEGAVFISQLFTRIVGSKKFRDRVDAILPR